jgi:hypothetical protein
MPFCLARMKAPRGYERQQVNPARRDTTHATPCDGGSQRMLRPRGGVALRAVAIEANLTDSEPDGTRIVSVPLNNKPLAPVTRARVRNLRMHLVESLRAMREMKHPERSVSPVLAEPDGLAGLVARTACSVCRGSCCKGGGEHAYLDERTMARVRQARPELEAGAIIGLYVACAPRVAYRDSCVFHGADGCTLDRTLRSDICNGYFCSALGRFVVNPDAPEGVVVIAREDGKMRRSGKVVAWTKG